MSNQLKKTLIELGDEVLAELNLEVVDLDLEISRARRVVTYFVDHPDGGVTIDECAAASRQLDWVIEEKALFNGAYILQVSSPGLNRRIARPRDFLRHLGKQAKIRLGLALEDGRKNFTGLLTAADESGFELETDIGVQRFEYNQLARANLVFDFDSREE